MKLFLIILLPAIFFTSCKQTVTETADIQENAQQIGDMMASIDESGNASGTITVSRYQLDDIKKTFARYAPEELENRNLFSKFFLPEAEAFSCLGYGYSSCTAGVIQRSFDGCTIGGATFTGGVSLTWSPSASDCRLDTAADYVNRQPNFSVTGRRSATLAVTKTSTNGQRLTVTTVNGASSVFAFSSDGIRRRFTKSGETLFDHTTSTSGTLIVTGTTRANRVITSSGDSSLKVVNNLSAVTCNYTPTNVTWSSTTCNCPVAGSWSGTCSDGRSATLEITGCGTATYTEGTDTQTVSFDRCASQ